MGVRDLLFAHRDPSQYATRHLMLKAMLVFCACLLLWICLARLDIVAVAPGKLVPQTYLRIVQPLEHGIVREILVREGEAVAEGQVLMRMDPRLTETDLKVVENDLRRKELQLRGIEAEIEGKPMGRRDGDDPVWLAQIEAQQLARRRAHSDALDIERSAQAKAAADLQAAKVVEARLQRTVPMYKATADGWAELAAQGFAGKLLAQERMRLYVESEHELKAQIQAVASLRSVVEQSARRLSQVESNYRQQLLNQRVEILSDIQRLREERERHAHRHRLTELRAPQAGIVKDLATHTAGTVAAPGTILLTLVPASEPLLAEVWINNEDIGFVRKDQPVRLKLSAFQFQKYGMVEGRIRHVSADASDASGAPAAAVEISRGRGSAPLAYKALVELTSQELVAQGKRYPLSPGMQVAAEIHLGTRSMLAYLLSPITGVLHEAGRER